MDNQRSMLKWLGVIVAVLFAVFTVEILVEARNVWPPFDIEGARIMVSTCSRSQNQLVALMFVSIALAIPLTSTNYTPKVLGLFISHRVHQVVLTGFVLAAAHSDWVMFLMGRGHVHPALIMLVLTTTMLGFSAVPPYFFYVIRFLAPSSVAQMICRLAQDLVGKATASPRALARARRALPSYIYGLGGVVLKAIDRVDRRSALDGIEAIRESLRHYGEHKSDFPDSWFEVTQSEFRGMSPEARTWLTTDKAWIEMLALTQLMEAFEKSIDRMPDAVSAVSDALRGIGVDATRRGDKGVVTNVIRALNTGLRVAIREHKPHAIFDVLYQYRVLGQQLAEHEPERIGTVARYLTFYGRFARQSQIAFLPSVVAYDLGGLCQICSARDGEATREVMDALVGMLRYLAKQPDLPMVCATLVSIAELIGRLPDTQLEPLFGVLDLLPQQMQSEALAVIKAADPRYWELTDRESDLNYLTPERLQLLERALEERAPQPDAVQSAR